jgi:hypothetical protein
MVVMTTRGRAVVLVVALALAASLLMLAVVLAKPAQAQAQTFTDTDRFPIGGTVYSCNDAELVIVEGTGRTVAHTTIDANGVYHTQLQSNLTGQGEGLDSGDKYVYKSVSSNQLNYSLAPGENFTAILPVSFEFIRQGSDTTTADWKMHALLHETINANGEVTSFVDNFRTSCP